MERETRQDTGRPTFIDLQTQVYILEDALREIMDRGHSSKWAFYYIALNGLRAAGLEPERDAFEGGDA